MTILPLCRAPFKFGFLIAVLSITSAAQSIPNTSTQPKTRTIKDPAEYSAYMKAMQLPYGVEKAQAFDRFLSQYPNTVVKADALKSELYVYQLIKNEDEVVRTAERLLEVEPTNLRMLALVASTYQQCATRNGANARMCAQSAAKYAHRGLDVIEKVQTPPEDMAADDFNALKSQVRPIFEQAARLEGSDKTSK